MVSKHGLSAEPLPSADVELERARRKEPAEGLPTAESHVNSISGSPIWLHVATFESKSPLGRRFVCAVAELDMATANSSEPTHHL